MSSKNAQLLAALDILDVAVNTAERMAPVVKALMTDVNPTDAEVADAKVRADSAMNRLRSLTGFDPEADPEAEPDVGHHPV